MGETVLLHHVDGPDEHWDLLLERDTPPGQEGEAEASERRLVAFRLPEPLDLTGVAEFGATRIGDHRAVYLRYEGPLPAPGGSPRARGTVRRVWRGTCRLHVETPTTLELTVVLDGRMATFVGEKIEGGEGQAAGLWWFTRR